MTGHDGNDSHFSHVLWEAPGKKTMEALSSHPIKGFLTSNCTRSLGII